MTAFVVTFAQRVGWLAFSFLLGRWLGPQLVHYVGAWVARPLLLPMAGQAIGAAISA
jgi:hypothetical protein